MSTDRDLKANIANYIDLSQRAGTHPEGVANAVMAMVRLAGFTRPQDDDDRDLLHRETTQALPPEENQGRLWCSVCLFIGPEWRPQGWQDDALTMINGALLCAEHAGHADTLGPNRPLGSARRDIDDAKRYNDRHAEISTPDRTATVVGYLSKTVGVHPVDAPVSEEASRFAGDDRPDAVQGWPNLVKVPDGWTLQPFREWIIGRVHHDKGGTKWVSLEARK